MGAHRIAGVVEVVVTPLLAAIIIVLSFAYFPDICSLIWLLWDGSYVSKSRIRYATHTV